MVTMGDKCSELYQESGLVDRGCWRQSLCFGYGREALFIGMNKEGGNVDEKGSNTYTTYWERWMCF